NTGATSTTLNQSQIYNTFGFSVSGTVKGFEVRVKVKVPDYSPIKNKPMIKLELSADGTNFVPMSPRYIRLMDIPGIVGNYVENIQGNPNDLWGEAGPRARSTRRPSRCGSPTPFRPAAGLAATLRSTSTISSSIATQLGARSPRSSTSRGSPSGRST